MFNDVFGNNQFFCSFQLLFLILYGKLLRHFLSLPNDRQLNRKYQYCRFCPIYYNSKVVFQVHGTFTNQKKCILALNTDIIVVCIVGVGKKNRAKHNYK